MSSFLLRRLLELHAAITVLELAIVFLWPTPDMENNDPAATGVLLFALGLVMIGTLASHFVSIAAMWQLINWGRWLFVGCMLVETIVYLGVSFESLDTSWGPAAVLSNINCMLAGGLIAIVFSRDGSALFSK